MKLKKNKLFIFILLLSNFFFYAQNLNDKQFEENKLLAKKIDSAFKLAVVKHKYNDALDIANNILNKKDVNDSIKAKAYNVIGIIFGEVRGGENGVKYFKKAINTFLKIKDTSRALTVYSNLGVNYRKRGLKDSSLIYLRKSLSLTKNYKKYPKLLYPLFNTADFLVNNDGDLKEAELYLKTGLKHYKPNPSNINAFGHLYMALGKLYYLEGKYKLASENYNKAIGVLKEIDDIKGLAEANRRKYELNKTIGNYQKAMLSLEKNIIYKDSLLKIENLTLTKKIETEFELRQKKQELLSLEEDLQNQQKSSQKSKLINLILTGLLMLLLGAVYLINKRNGQLERSRQKAEKLARAKSDFYSEVSHELRTPLYGVIELSNILLKENINEQHTEYLKSLNFSGNHLLSLINNVLNLNKLEYSEPEVINTKINLKQLTTNILESLEYALNESNNKLELHYDNTIPNNIMGDSLKLSQILINLISNAVKFTTNGVISLTIKPVSIHDNSVKLYFEVKDTGMGMTKNIQKHIFKEFYQDTSKYTRSQKGTGLGLSIVKRFLTLMGSEINMESQVDKGSKFYFTIDFDRSNTKALTNKSLDVKLDVLKDCKFLIVDDNRINQLVTKKILDQFNFQSKVVSSGAEAIALVKKEHIDCILMDLHMPELDGFETTSKIREFNNEVTIVALTAASKEEVVTKIKTVDMQGYVMKPFVVDNFIEKITQGILEKKEIKSIEV